MKVKNNIGNFLFKNFILIVILSVAIFFLSVTICKVFFESFLYKDSNFGFKAPMNISAYPVDKPDTKSIKSYGGWVEILDADYKVVYIDGKKQDKTYQYDINKLFLDSSAFHNNSKEYPYIYNIYPFNGSDAKAYLYMIILPKNVYHVSIGANLKAIFLYPNSMILLTLIMVSGIFLILFLVGMQIYSKYTAKHIKTPLKYLMDGIQELEKHNYNFRMDFYAESEFSYIKDSFNSMAERLETIESEKKRLEESRHRMLVDISHDLKTPMTSICGFSKLLFEGENLNPEDQRRYIDYIYHKSIYASKLLQDLFDLSKLEDESFHLVLTRQNFLEWLRLIISENYTEFEKKDFILDIDFSETPIFLYFDEMQMTRAVNNLLMNALIHNPEKTCVAISCFSDKDNVILQIADNGIGIPEDIRSNIFNPFVMGDNKNALRNGSGLGLAITKSIIEKHGGTIELLSNEKMVTEFLITIPLS